MTTHVFREENVTPVTKSINLRSFLDTGGPHLLSFGLRTTVSDPSATSTYVLKVRYENPNGEIRSIDDLPGVSLNQTSQLNGGIWYHDVLQTSDTYWPLANGPYPEEPLGVFSADFTLFAPPLTSKITYEIVLQVFDGSPAVVYHP